MRRIATYAVARRLGMPVVVAENKTYRFRNRSDRSLSNEAYWDAKEQCLYILPAYDEQLSHELAHWIVAGWHNERDRQDFGCSDGNLDYLGKERAEEREDEARQIEELLEAVIDATVRECGRMNPRGEE